MDRDAEPPSRWVDITVENRSSVLVDVDRLRQLARAALLDEGVVGPAHLDIAFVDPDVIHVMNRDHMGKDRPTDVLSFPIDEEPAPLGGPPRLIGDIVVCSQQAASAPAVADPARNWGLDDELALLIVHGVLHLLGYDHDDPDDRSAMQQRERELLAAFADLTYVPGPETQTEE